MKKLGEFGLIDRFLSKLPSQKAPGILIGPGDDAAVIREKRDLIFTTDMLAEGIHFRREWMTLEEIGRKAIRVNVSDIAAMGGIPRYALISVGLPKSLSLKEIDKLLVGLAHGVREAGVTVLGGDTNSASSLVINITLIGVSSGRVLTRGGAKVGDFLYTTGSLGNSALGLEALRRGKKKGFELFIQSHRLPPDRIRVGHYLAKNRNVHAAIDLSDGLAGDLSHILQESSVGAEIFVDRLPAAKDFRKKAAELKIDPLRLQLSGGEDYELLFTARGAIPQNIAGVPISKIGKILPHKMGLRWIGSKGSRVRIPFQKGFEHF